MAISLLIMLKRMCTENYKIKMYLKIIRFNNLVLYSICHAVYIAMVQTFDVYVEVSDFATEKVTSLDAIRIFVPRNTLSDKVQYWLKCFDSMFHEEQRAREAAGTVENLGEYVNYLGKLHCFISINNFQGIDMDTFMYPVVLKQPRPLLLPHDRGKFDIEMFWVPHHLYPTNGSRGSKSIITQNCKLSRFLASFWEKGKKHTMLVFSDYCLRINRQLFALSAKSWNCEAQVELFPLMKLHEPPCALTYYPRTFKFEERTPWSTSTMLSISAPNVNIVITHDMGSTGMMAIQGLVLGRYTRFDFRDSLSSLKVHQMVIFHGIVTIVDGGIISQEPVFTIQYLRLVKIFYRNALFRKPEEMIILIKYVMSRFKPGNLSQTLTLTSSPSTEQRLVWNAMYHLPCYNKSFQRKTQRSATEIATEFRNRAWPSIFGNYTYRLGPDTSRTNGEVEAFTFPDESRLVPLWALYLTWNVQEELYLKGQPMSQTYIDTTKSLRFISCSELNHEPLQFIELINIYQKSVWVCLICSMLSLAVFISHIAPRKESLVKNLLGIFKVVVGQGDPFMHNVFCSVPLRCASTTYLFMGIIISEGYKNSNMYNLISPRKVMSKENISELTSDKFTTYTRASSISFYTNIQGFVSPDQVKFEVNKHTILARQIAFVRSEVHFTGAHQVLHDSSSLHPTFWLTLRKIILEHQGWFQYPLFKQFFLEEAAKGNVSLNSAQILSKLETYTYQEKDYSASQLSRLMEITKKWEKSFEEREASAFLHSSVLNKIIRKWQEETLFNFLQNCTNAALLLPEYFIMKYAKRLRISKTQHVAIGRELFAPRPSGKYLEGFIPPTIIKRVKWSATSGIWEWHPSLVRPGFGDISSYIKPSRATMSGHVLVIFLLLLAGCTLAALGFLFEMCLYHLVRIFVVKINLVSRTFSQATNALVTITTILMGLVNLVQRQTNILSITAESHFLSKSH